ncbi:MAG: chorismate lyase [Dechloromonas sp.]|nr:chorismate lyase [Dechloromonas sp.]
MKQRKWRPGPNAVPADPILECWLTEPGSLTARCQRHCQRFCVRVVRDGLGKALAEHEHGRSLARVREVILECDGVPVIFAHTTMAVGSRGRMTRWMAGLGSRSLGSLLFSYPGFRRGRIEYLRIDERHPLYRRAAAQCALRGPLWARRSLHRLDGQAVLVTEVFLPAITALE